MSSGPFINGIKPNIYFVNCIFLVLFFGAGLMACLGKHSAYLYVDFKDGYVSEDDMNLANPIRLVRSPSAAH